MTDTTVVPTFSVSLPPPDPNIEIVDVTPELAEKWLAKNTHNRNLRERQSILYATDMVNGDWRWTGEGIKFGKSGRLLDGQHRLHAIVLSGVTVRMLVVRNLDDKAQEDVDRGVPRKFHDVLALRGESDASSLAALVRKVHGWEAGRRRDVTGFQATVAQMLRTLDAHPELRDITRRARTLADHIDLPGSVIGLCVWLFERIDEEDAHFFFERLADAQGLLKGDPIYELRRTLAGTKDVRGERSQTFLLAITIKAWNAYRRGESVGLYRWKPGGAKPESFPEPL